MLTSLVRLLESEPGRSQPNIFLPIWAQVITPLRSFKDGNCPPQHRSTSTSAVETSPAEQ